MTGLCAVWNHTEAQLFIHIRRKNSSLQRPCRYGRRKEKALIQRTVQIQRGTDLLSQTGRAQTVCASVNTALLAADIAADRSQTAAGIFNQRADNHIRTHVGRLNHIHKFTVAVIHHANHIRLDFLNKCNQLPNLLHRKGRAHGITLGTLNRHQLCLFIDGFSDGRIVKCPILHELHLSVADPVFHQRAGRGHCPDDVFQCIIRLADRGKQFIPGQKVRTQRDCQCMCAAGNLGAHQSRLCPKAARIYLFQLIAPIVIVAIARRACKAGTVHAFLLHGTQHLRLIIFRHRVNFFKAFL